MPEVPPDPRAVINERIHHFKKQTQKLNLEFIEAQQELEKAKEAVRLSRQRTTTAVRPATTPVAVPQPTVAQPTMTIVPFAGGVGYALKGEGADFWFDNEIHAINYAQDLYPYCDIVVMNTDGTLRHRYNATAQKSA